MEQFREIIDRDLDRFGLLDLPFNAEEFHLYEDDYCAIRDYAYAHHLANTLFALPTVRSLHNGMYRGYITLKDGSAVRRPYVAHVLSVARMMIRLNLELTPREKDIALAAALCHDIPAFVPSTHHTDELSRVYHIDPEVVDLVELIYTRDCVTDDDFDALFERVAQNKLAILVKVIDRGNVVESLHNVSVWRANEYIHETRTYYLPLCITARERYPEFYRALGIVQEKLRDLTEATEIFSTRFMNLEKELTVRILQVTDDNARMRIQLRNAGIDV